MGIPVGYQATVTRTAKITVPYRCRACGFEDTALVEGMGSGVGGGRYYSRDQASGLASVAASEVIERDAKAIAAAIDCPRCHARGQDPASLPHPMLDAVRRQAWIIGGVTLLFVGPWILTGGWGGLVIVAGVGVFLYQRHKKAHAVRAAFVERAVAEAALWTVSPERFPRPS